jgi:hypothetical protein
MATKNITVNGEVFRCPIDWTVDQAESKIRSAYLLAGYPHIGYLQEGGVPLLGTQRMLEPFHLLGDSKSNKVGQQDLVVFLI